MNLIPLRWNITLEEGRRRRPMGLSHKHWRFASAVAHHTGINNFEDALAVFAWGERRRIHLANSSRAMERPEADPSWVSTTLFAFMRPFAVRRPECQAHTKWRQRSLKKYDVPYVTKED
jgi:hypothetical protein